MLSLTNHKNFPFLSIKEGQNAADFHFGTTNVPLAPQFNKCLTALPIIKNRRHNPIYILWPIERKSIYTACSRCPKQRIKFVYFEIIATCKNITRVRPPNSIKKWKKYGCSQPNRQNQKLCSPNPLLHSALVEPRLQKNLYSYSNLDKNTLSGCVINSILKPNFMIIRLYNIFPKFEWIF